MSNQLDAYVADFDLHRGTEVQLDANETIHFSIGPVVIDQHAHDMSVKNLDEHVVARDNVVSVPAAVFNQAFQFGAVAQRTDNSRLFAICDIGELPAQSQEAASSFFIDLARVALLGIDVRLGREGLWSSYQRPDPRR